jgi:hypothetical protein
LQIEDITNTSPGWCAAAHPTRDATFALQDLEICIISSIGFRLKHGLEPGTMLAG